MLLWSKQDRTMRSFILGSSTKSPEILLFHQKLKCSISQNTSPLPPPHKHPVIWKVQGTSKEHLDLIDKQTFLLLTVFLFHPKTHSEDGKSKLTEEFTWIAVASWNSPGGGHRLGREWGVGSRHAPHPAWLSWRSYRNSSLWWSGYSISSSIKLQWFSELGKYVCFALLQSD